MYGIYSRTQGSTLRHSHEICDASAIRHDAESIRRTCNYRKALMVSLVALESILGQLHLEKRVIEFRQGIVSDYMADWRGSSVELS